MGEQDDLDLVAKEYMATREVIVNWLMELPACPPDAKMASLERWAEKLMARLASHDPPILFTMEERT